MDEAHGVNGIQGHHHLRRVELGPLLRHVVGAGEVDQVASRHVLHHHVEVVLVLEGAAQLSGPKATGARYSLVRQNLFGSEAERGIKMSYLHDPGAVGEGHDVPLFPEEGRVRALDHLELAQHLHGVDLLRGFVPDLNGDETRLFRGGRSNGGFQILRGTTF